ncbi:MAG: hypothetical protein ACR2GL_03025 [Thermoleophilaceae bacterium]
MLGGVCGLRTFTAPALLVLRGRLGGHPARHALLAAAIGELAADKHPAIPARVEPPALAARLISAALVGRAVAGARGVPIAAAAAAGAAFAGHEARGRIGERTGASDPLLGAIEDAVAIAVAALGSRPR